MKKIIVRAPRSKLEPCLCRTPGEVRTNQPYRDLNVLRDQQQPPQCINGRHDSEAVHQTVMLHAGRHTVKKARRELDALKEEVERLEVDVVASWEAETKPM